MFRKVLLASAAIPAVFPPGFVEVAANGTVYEEMHVDGGATREVFLLPTQILAKNVDSTLNVKPIRRSYIIRNGRVGPEWKAVKPRTLSIAGRSISTLIKNQGIGDLYELYAFTKRNGMDYNLIYIPSDFADTSTQAFDPVYMTKLYDLGFQMASNGKLLEESAAALGSLRLAATSPSLQASRSRQARPDRTSGRHRRHREAA